MNDMNDIVAWVLTQANLHPKLATILMIMGALRAVFKPAMALLEKFFTDTGHPDEAARVDAFEKRVEASRLWQMASWLLDLAFSVKAKTSVVGAVNAAQSAGNAIKGLIKGSSVIAILAIAGALLMGCKSPEQATYRTLGTTVNVVDLTMKGWAQYVVAGKATAEQEIKVKAAYRNYQKAMSIAHAAVDVWLISKQPPAQADVFAKADQAAQELIALIGKLKGGSNQ